MTRINKKAYTQLIDEDIAELEKYLPKDSLELMHIIIVLKWSIKEIYDEPKEFMSCGKGENKCNCKSVTECGYT